MNKINKQNFIITNLPTEILIYIFMDINDIIDLLNIYKSCKLFMDIIEENRLIILSKLFKKNVFTDHYYNLFYSFVNKKYEFAKREPYTNLKQLLDWNWEYKSFNDNFHNVSNIVARDIDITRRLLIRYFIEDEKYIILYVEDSLEVFKHFLYLLYLPSDYIYKSKFLLNKYFKIHGLSLNNDSMETINLQSELQRYIGINSSNHIHQYGIIISYLYKIYPDLLINHIVNFEKFVKKKKFKKILHNFIINLFLEWLFDKECIFIEKIYEELLIRYPEFIKKALYRIIYAEFREHHFVWTDDFINEFYDIHRIFLPSSKIFRLYKNLRLVEYRQNLMNKVNWQEYLCDIQNIFQ